MRPFRTRCTCFWKESWRSGLGCLFTKHVKGGNDIRYNARVITYTDLKEGKKTRLISLQTNDMETDAAEIIAIYRKRWETELLFKQLKENFPLRYSCGGNAIKIQVCDVYRKPAAIVLQAHQSHVGLFLTSTMVMLMYYVNCYTFFESPEKDWAKIVEEAKELLP